jgi:DNA polymerase-3 subunit delta
MVIFLYGIDNFRSRRKLNELVANFREREDKSGMNTAFFEASAALGDVQQALFSPAFLGNKRLVVLSGFLGLKREEQLPYLALLEKIPESTTAVFYEILPEEKLEKSPLFSLLTSGKFHWEFAPLTAVEMSNWLTAEAKACGASFELPALSLLAEAVGGDTAKAAAETAKLSAYAGSDKIIKAADVALMVTAGTEDDMFGFLDAVASGQSKKAVTILEKQIDFGSEPMQILSMLARTVRLLIQARDLMDNNVPQNIAVKELGVHPFAARKTLTQAAGLKMVFLRGLHQALVETDKKIKSGFAGSARVALDLFVAKALGADNG